MNRIMLFAELGMRYYMKGSLSKAVAPSRKKEHNDTVIKKSGRKNRWVRRQDIYSGIYSAEKCFGIEKEKSK